MTKDFNQYCGENCHLLPIKRERVNLTQIPSQKSLVKENNNVEPTTILGLTVLLTIVFAGIVTWLQQSEIKKKLRDDQDLNSQGIQKKKYLNSIPCNQCQYFHHNFYLKCAVNPSKVLQPEAKECSDYIPQPRNKFLKFRRSN